ncbi:MAG: SHOCT domain-containing protein [Chlorobi bacterium]|nr:SHOCT domain-containing protein [Chlorobiota bacterium]
MMHNWSFWGMSMMWLIWLPLIALFVWFVVQTIRKTGTTETGGKPNPQEILKARFARGELSAEELEENLQTLHRH